MKLDLSDLDDEGKRAVYWAIKRLHRDAQLHDGCWRGGSRGSRCLEERLRDGRFDPERPVPNGTVARLVTRG